MYGEDILSNVIDYTTWTSMLHFWSSIFPLLYTLTPYAFAKNYSNSTATGGGLHLY